MFLSNVVIKDLFVVTKILRKTSAKMFNHTKVGDVIEISYAFDGQFVYFRNLNTNETTCISSNNQVYYDILELERLTDDYFKKKNIEKHVVRADAKQDKLYVESDDALTITEYQPSDIKVHIWGYELCNGAQWQDFLDIVNKLGSELEDTKQKLKELECKE